MRPTPIGFTLAIHVLVLVVVLGACGSGDGPPDAAPEPTPTAEPASEPEPTPTEPAEDEPTPTATAVATEDGSENADGDQQEAARLEAADAAIDAFYSYDPARLEGAVGDTRDTPFILYYQGWAEGGNYGVLDRMPCEVASSSAVRCSITVEDDFAKALQLDFNVTDTFTFLFNDADEITGVTTSSDDPALVGEAFQWANANRRDALDVPCDGFFNGGPTPGDCARTFAGLFAEFISLSDEERDG